MTLYDLLDTAAGRFALWAAGAAGLLYLVRLLWKVFKVGRRATATVTRLGDALLGDEETGRLGMPERLDAVDGRLAAIEGELHPNGGGSLRDAVNRLEKGQQAADGRLAALESRLTALEAAKPVTVNVGTPTPTP